MQAHSRRQAISQPPYQKNTRSGTKREGLIEVCKTSRLQVTMAKGGVPWQTQLNLMLSQNELPHTATLARDWTIINQLVDEEYIVPIDKYFNDPVNYPNFAKADKITVAPCKVEGKLYGIPTLEWAPITTMDAFGFDMPRWIYRGDVPDTIGLPFPKTVDEMPPISERPRAWV